MKESSCYSCDKYFHWYTWEDKCTVCTHTFCSSCIDKEAKDIETQFLMLSKSPVVNGNYCADCTKKKILPHTKKLKLAEENINKIEVYSINFHGKIPIEPKAKEVEFTTKFFRNKDDAIKSAKIIAGYFGYDVIYKFKFAQETESEAGGRKNDYYYSVWSYSGLLGKSAKK